MNGTETAPEWIHCLKGFRLKAAIYRYFKISTLRKENQNRCNTKHVRAKNVFICRHKPKADSSTLWAAQKSTSSDDLQVLSRLRPSKDVPAYEISWSTTWNYFASTIGQLINLSGLKIAADEGFATVQKEGRKEEAIRRRSSRCFD